MSSITILLPDLRGGGAERLSIDLAREFRRLGHDPNFLVMSARGELLDEASSSFPVENLGCTRLRQVPVVLTDRLRQKAPDAILAAIWPLTVAAAFATRIASRKCRVVISEHNQLSLQYKGRGLGHRTMLRCSMAAGYRMADARVAVSRGVAEDMARLSGLSRSRFTVISNPIPQIRDASEGQLAEAESLWETSSGARILAVGRLKRQKNHPLLLRAFARLDRAHARLMLLGDGELESKLRRLASELGIADRVIFAGFHPDPTPFYRTADLFVLSSDYEGFGNVIVEALASGTPVVSTDCPSGPSEILRAGEFGTLVPVGDADALARAIEDALARPDDPERLRARARDFAPEKAAKAYLDLLFPSA